MAKMAVCEIAASAAGGRREAMALAAAWLAAGWRGRRALAAISAQLALASAHHQRGMAWQHGENGAAKYGWLAIKK